MPGPEVVIVQPRPLPPPGHRDGRVAVLVTPGRGSHCAQLSSVMRPAVVPDVIVVAKTAAVALVVVQLILVVNSDTIV